MGYNISLAVSVNKLTSEIIQTVLVMFFKDIIFNLLTQKNIEPKKLNIEKLANKSTLTL